MQSIMLLGTSIKRVAGMSWFNIIKAGTYYHVTSPENAEQIVEQKLFEDSFIFSNRSSIVITSTSTLSKELFIGFLSVEPTAEIECLSMNKYFFFTVDTEIDKSPNWKIAKSNYFDSINSR